MKYLVLLFIALPLSALAQKKVYMLSDTPIKIDSATGGMVYTEVIKVDSATEEQLFSRAKSFITRVFTNESAVTHSEDKATGVVTGRGKLAYKVPTAAMIITGMNQMYYEMTAEIRVKEGRYRYEFSNFEFISGGMRVRMDEQFQKHPEQAEKLRNRPMSQREYDRYTSDKNPMMGLIRELKATMSPPRSKNDF
jgi:hypothetical protein